MTLRPFLRLLRNHQLLATLRVNALFKPFYKLSWLASAKTNGVLDILTNTRAPFDRLAATYCRDAKAREALEAWLQVGIRLQLLELNAAGYALKGLARELALPHNDATLALAQEVAGLHHKLILDTPRKLRNGELWHLDDQDGALIARSSRALEAFQVEAIEQTFPASGGVRLLEVGCGSAWYIRHAAEQNPALTAVGLELQPEVAALARRNVAAWNLADRITIEVGDIRRRTPVPEFDIVTLYNNIYYFPVADRPALLEHARGFVNPDGFLLLTTCCQGGNPGMEVLNLWGAATDVCGRLPAIEEMAGQLKDAGFANVRAISLIPGDRFYAFVARTTAPARSVS